MHENWLGSLLEGLANSPLLQGIVAAVSTFILEDPTTIGCGFLVADGKMHFITALVALSAGIALGDFGLYWIGRWLGPRVLERGWISTPRLERAKHWFDRNLIMAILLSRFIPGMRLPTYLGAGVLGVSAWRFLGIAIGASIAWTFLLLNLTIELGQAIFPLLGRWRWPVGIALLAGVVLIQWLLGRGDQTAYDEVDNPPMPVASRFEFWPAWLFYIPVALYYVWLGLRHRGLTLPTAANPRIYAGGFIGESKSQILDLVPPLQQEWIAPWMLLDVQPGTQVPELLERVQSWLAESGLELPLVAKPDRGQRGDGVQPIRSWADLENYLEHFPPGGRLMVQQLVPWSGEAGILYYRYPDQEQGQVFSLTLKAFPEVTGDGACTLRQLITRDPRATRMAAVYFRRHRKQLDRVLAKGERFPLVFSGNHCQGAIFRNGNQEVTPQLAAWIDRFARSMPEFYFGRFDLKFQDLQALRSGAGLRIVEINGAGAEATHIWDPATRLREAYRVLFQQFKILFEIGAENRRRGARPMKLRRLLREVWRYRAVASKYPETL